MGKNGQQECTNEINNLNKWRAIPVVHVVFNQTVHGSVDIVSINLLHITDNVLQRKRKTSAKGAKTSFFISHRLQ